MVRRLRWRSSKRPGVPASPSSRSRSRARRSTTCSCITPGGRCATVCRRPIRWIAASSCEGTDMGRTWAIIERELRLFRRSPVLMAMSMVMPIVQLVVLGYAFGGNVKHLKLAIVDQDHGVPAVRIREMTSAVSSGAHTLDTVDYADQGEALT